MRRPSGLLAALCLFFSAGLPLAAAADPLSPAAATLAAYLRLDNSNPPGNERTGAEFLARELRAAGVEPRLLVSPAGRANLYARLPATAALPGPPGGAIVLLHHIDTVAAGEGWRYPPFAGEVHDAELWGRGAIDAKGLGIAHLMAFLELARSPQPRHRDVLFVAAADEEAGGGEGISWLLGAHPELFSHVAAVLNEGGVNKAVAGRALYWGIEVDQKRPLWLEVRAAGRGGHASAASPESATHRLISGLSRLVAAPRAWRVTPAAEAFLAGLSGFDPQARKALAELRSWKGRAPQEADEAASAEGGRRTFPLAGFESLLTDTLQVTTLAGSRQINVVAGEARAGVDVRLLPDSDEKRFVGEVERRLGPGFEVEVLLSAPAAAPSPTTGALYRTLASELAREGGAPVVPAFIPAFTDSRVFRARGIAAYGVSPFALDGLTLRTVHAPDERIPLAVFDRGVATMNRIVRALASLDSTNP